MTEEKLENVSRNDPIWEILPNETRQQYWAFQCYMKTGSLRRAYALYRADGNSEQAQPAKTVSQAFFVWSKKFDWERRLRAFERHMREVSFREITQNRANEFDRRSELYLEIANQAHAIILERLNGDAKTAKLTDILEIVKYYDQEYLNEMERKNLQRLRERLAELENSIQKPTTVR